MKVIVPGGRRLDAAFLFVMLLFVLGACRPSNSGDDTTELVYGLTLPPSGIDPQINASAELGIALRSVYDTLVYRNAEARDFVPGMAATWDISPDGLAYTFTLRQGVVFHDGASFDAEAVR